MGDLINKGVGEVGKFFFGNNGTQAEQASQDPRALDALRARSANANSPQMQALLSKVGSGQMSIQDAMGQAGGMGNGALDALSTNGVTGSKVAANEVQNGALTKGLFGQGGIQDQAQGQFGKLNQNQDEDRQALMGKGEQYGLTDNDLKAYGQASGDIARQFGSQGNSLAQSLASRGLSSAPSGAAGAQFTTLQGNQNEQLAKMQQNIAQSRINTAKDLAQFRSTADANRAAQNNQLMQGLGQLGQSALSSQYDRQLQGSKNADSSLTNLANTNMTAQQQQQDMNNKQFDQQQASRNPGLIEGLTQGVKSGLSSGVADTAKMFTPSGALDAFSKLTGGGKGGGGGMAGLL